MWNDENIRNKGKAGSLHSYPRWWINLILCQLFSSFHNHSEVTDGNLRQIFDKDRIYATFPQITLSVYRLVYNRPIVLEGQSNITTSLNIRVVNIKFLKWQFVRIRINYSQHTHFFSSKEMQVFIFIWPGCVFILCRKLALNVWNTEHYFTSHIVRHILYIQLDGRSSYYCFLWFFFWQWLTQEHQLVHSNVISAIWWAVCKLRVANFTHNGWSVSTAANKVLATWQSVPLSH
jgi:hypothetical protein